MLDRLLLGTKLGLSEGSKDSTTVGQELGLELEIGTADGTSYQHKIFFC